MPILTKMITKPIYKVWQGAHCASAFLQIATVPWSFSCADVQMCPENLPRKCTSVESNPQKSC